MDIITFPENLQTTSGLSILLHGIISLQDATSYDKSTFPPSQKLREAPRLLFGKGCDCLDDNAEVKKSL